MQSKTLSREMLFAAATLVTVLSSGGLVLGFGPVYTRLVSENQWHELCPSNKPRVCPEQEVQLQNVYSTGFLCVVLGQAVFGATLDLIGPRYTTTIAALVFYDRWQPLPRDRHSRDGLLLTGYALVGFGGMGVLFASLQLSELFATPSIYCGILVAAFYASGYMYVLLELPIARATFFQAYAGLVALCAVICFALYPVEHVSAVAASVPIPGLALGRPHADLSKFQGLYLSFKQQVRRRDFWAFVSIGAILTLTNVFVGGAIPNMVKRLSPDDLDEQNTYTNYVYPLVSNASFLFAPLMGYLIDRMGFRKAAIVTILVFALLCGAMMLPSLHGQVLGYLLLALGVGSLTSIQYAYIMACFPSKLYGLLSGTATLLVFVFCLVSFALTPLAQHTFDGNNNYVLVLLLAPTLAALLLVRFVCEPVECTELHTQLLSPTNAEPDGMRLAEV
ncbi:hypothetical protein SPRG_10886 [Saprolegnia parasitica CBS 223.65]|uniref:Major facilitator superfamily (MFS) profile domain-containing protein n=1 Tax=Saprolegnia parasitica (strain CBS 223.65) TaxID=695850 RepID=A0A067BZZ7_SAPPC|nr:hypothetical protein SPRG_10886 [Saprolegnia parasitica CBS 223.65]KDO24099.1 hypothetical protein SPRG_10886 [Saprolegnia parasitica CBS 223.65]|eukprot:XP_012205235.1 hypothetical protein SPRG_10886 [Saprolegnia parasitica CBS 223.65]